MKVLALSIHDLRYSNHGNARLSLSTLGAMALGDTEVLYLNVAAREDSMSRLYVRSRYGKTHFKFICLSSDGISQNPASYLNLKSVITELCEAPHVILCEDRRLVLLCKTLSIKYEVPIMLRLDSLKYLYYKDLLKSSTSKLSELSKVPLAIASYIAWTAISDAAICVSKYMEAKFRSLGCSNVRTVEPTFMLLDRTSDLLSSQRVDLNELPSNLVLCSCPKKLAIYLASKTPEVSYVITGPSAFYTREFLKNLKSRPRNLFFLWNIGDSLLEELHKKVKLAVIARPLLTGVSMTHVQELYFGLPAIVDSNVASSLNDVSRSGAIVVEDNYLKWPSIVKTLMRDRQLLEDMGVGGERFFDKHLSPIIHANLIRRILSQIGIA